MRSISFSVMREKPKTLKTSKLGSNHRFFLFMLSLR